MNNQITRLNVEIANLEDEKEQLQSQADNASTQYNIGALGILIGLLMFFLSIYWLGSLLFLAGALAVLTQGNKKRKLNKQIEDIHAQVKERRNKIIELAE